MGERLIRYSQQRPELLFVIKALLLVVLLKMLQDIFYLWWFTILLCSPVFIFLLFQVISIHQNKSLGAVFADNLTFIPAPYLERDNKYQIVPWATYSLIGVNVALFYLVMPSLSDETIGNLLFVPSDITFFNTLISQLSNLFLHSDGWHLWGNMAFLWAMGTALEKRVGSSWLIGLYLAVGFSSNLLFLLAALIEKNGNLDFATRCLEMLLNQAELTPASQNKCLFHCSRLCKKMGLDEAAEMYSTRQVTEPRSVGVSTLKLPT